MLFPLFLTISVAAGGMTVAACGLFSGALSLLWLLLLALDYFLLCLACWALFVLIMSMTVDQGKPAGENQKHWRWLITETLRLIFTLIRTKITVTGMDLIPRGSRFLFTCNHITIYDPMIALVALRNHDITFISKKENMDRKVFGNLIHASGILSIDRENDRAAVRTVLQAVKLLKNDYTSIALYPEGYCKTDPDTVLLPFRDGSLKIAQKAGVPIVVSTIRGTERIIPGILRNLYTEVNLDILAVIPAEEVCSGTTHEVGEKIWKTMYDKLSEGACEL